MDENTNLNLPVSSNDSGGVEYQINFHFSEYKLPEKPDFLDRPMMFIAEIFNLPGYRNEVELSLTLQTPTLFLEGKNEISLAGNLIKRNDAGKFRLKNWTLSINENKQAEIDVNLTEIKPSPTETLFAGLSSNNRAFVIYATFFREE